MFIHDSTTTIPNRLNTMVAVILTMVIPRSSALTLKSFPGTMSPNPMVLRVMNEK